MFALGWEWRCALNGELPRTRARVVEAAKPAPTLLSPSLSTTCISSREPAGLKKIRNIPKYVKQIKNKY